MKVIFDKDQLVDAITPALSAVAANNTVSAYEGILFTTDGSSKCILTTYDGEKGYRTTVDAEVYEHGSFIINATKLYRIIKVMPDDRVEIEVNDRCQAKIASGNSRFALPALPSGDFQSLPDISGGDSVSIKQAVLKKMIGQVQHAISFGNQRLILSGAFLKMTENGITMVTCDGNRLAIREKNCPITLGEKGEKSVIVPGKTIIELAKMLNGDTESDMVVAIKSKHIIFHLGNSVFFSKLIDSEYLDYNRTIPKNNNIKVKINRTDLVECLERVQLVSEDKSLGQIAGCVKFIFTDGILKVSSNSSIYSVSEELEVEKTGDDITIGFSCRFLLDALRAVTDEKICISLGTPLMSIIIEEDPDKPENEESENEKKEDEGKYLYMVCPVKLRE